MSGPGGMSERTALAAAWLVASRVLARVIDLLALLVLARLLGPAEFGMIAVVMPVIYIVEALFELPLTQALVRVPVLTRPLLDTSLTLGLIRGGMVAGLVATLAWPFAQFNEDPSLVALVGLLGLAPAIRGLASPSMVVFVRRVDFRRDIFVDLLGKGTAALVMIGTGFVTHSHWAIAAGTIAGPCVMTTASYVLAPQRLRLTLAEWRSFSDLIGWNSLSQLFAATTWQIDRLLLGRLAERVELGRFAMANDLAAAPYQALVSPILRPLIASLVTVAGNRHRLHLAYVKAAAAVVLVGAPVLAGIAVLADVIVRIALGPQWQSTGPMLAWLALGGIAPLLVTPFGSLAMTLGRAQFITLQCGLEFLVKVPAMTLAVIEFGVAGAVATRVMAGLVMSGITMLAVRRMAGLPLRVQLLAAWRPLVAALAMALALLPLTPALAALPGGPALVTAAAGTVALGALAYALVLGLLWHLAGRPAGAEALIMDCLRRVPKVIFGR